MLLTDLDQAAPDEVARLAGRSLSGRCARGVYAGPCPLCNAERAHTRKGRADKRAALLIRDQGAVTCCSCEVSFSRADLLALSRYGRAWKALDAFERAACLDAPTPTRAPPVEPPRWLSGEVWARLQALCRPARLDPACRAWAEGRGLILPADALAVVGDPVEDVPLWTSKGGWLPDMGGRLILPCYGGDGLVHGARVRNIWRDAMIKEQALRGYSATGLVYIPPLLQVEWAQGQQASRPCTIVEGGPDRMAAANAWRDRYVIGVYNGSWGQGQTWIRGLHPDTVFVHQEDAADKHGHRKGQEYGVRLQLLAPFVRLVGVSAVWRAAGEAWVEGDDLAALAERAKVPAWADIEGQR
jgi:hypothetical protein